MQILTPQEIAEWVRIDTDQDVQTLNMLEAGAIDIVEHHTGLRLLPYTDIVTGEAVTPLVPLTLKHAIAVLVHGHYDDRTGADERTMQAVQRLCAPWRVPRL